MIPRGYCKCGCGQKPTRGLYIRAHKPRSLKELSRVTRVPCSECGELRSGQSKSGLCRPCSSRRNKGLAPGPTHPNWKGDEAKRDNRLERGRSIARKMYPLEGVKCERCSSPAEQRHHKDEDVFNNGPTNIELLCNSCHQLEHWRRRGLGK